MSETVFTRTDPRLGTFALRPVDPNTDTELLHRWLTHPKSVFWQMSQATPADVEQEFRTIAADPHRDAFIGLHEARPAFLVERYDPAHSELNGKYRAEPGDIGMHFLVAPTDTPVHGFTHAVISTVMELLFAAASTDRVVVEPDVRNQAVHALNAAVGFQVVDTVSLPDKDAYLSTCTREQYRAAVREQGAHR
ncbi:GNAT family N-acetyltransferase [Allosalinactinospora lopnorensis]|uniref:GNAT family N-acetyltransferase n=1 Tax=Allosalinactinospora lopnorensis TaxID=1352348 RepID=UPI000623CAD8|nr:GNAT family N-acetyltransferase [Allosalinactinospora lopnorensis]